MSILTTTKRLIIATSLSLALPLGALADAPPGAGPDPAWEGHEHVTHGCAMMMHGMPGPELRHEGMFLGGPMSIDDGPPGFMRKLNLTEAQQDKIFAIQHAQAPQARDLSKAERKAHRELHDLVTSASFDEAKAKALTDALGKAVAQSALLHARTHHQIMEVLTPEQRQALEKDGPFGAGGDHGPRHHDDHDGMSQ